MVHDIRKIEIQGAAPLVGLRRQNRAQIRIALGGHLVVGVAHDAGAWHQHGLVLLPALGSLEELAVQGQLVAHSYLVEVT